jgi:uncharacterized protein YecT (DUF1311 family)
MKFLVVALWMTIISFACFAQDAAEYRACSDKAKSQSEITRCANAEAARVDAKLNRHTAPYWQASRATRSPRKN